MSAPHLIALSNIISDGVKAISVIYEDHRAQFPSLDDPAPQDSIEDPAVSNAMRLIRAAAAQLMATVAAPSQIVSEAALSVHCTAAIGTANNLNIAEILREAEPQGMHISDIAKVTGTDPNKLGRVLRFLATRHIFREVSTDTFANNRISSALDTGVPFKELQAHSSNKYTNSSHSISAMVGHTADEGAKGSVYIPDYMATPEACSDDALATPLNMALGTSKHWFDWLEEAPNKARLLRHGAAMSATSSMGWAEATVAAYDWAAVSKGSLVVDVGGGVGSVTLALARAHPHLKYMIQDRAAVLSDAKEFWSTNFPSALERHLIQFQAHNFFQPQPAEGASVFILRLILHDWPNKYCKDILRKLRSAAQPETRLIIVDHIVPSACIGTSESRYIPGQQHSAPWPLLPNYGDGFVHSLDMQMMTFVNGQERTISEFVDLLNGTGWELERFAPGIGAVSHLICGGV